MFSIPVDARVAVAFSLLILPTYFSTAEEERTIDEEQFPGEELFLGLPKPFAEHGPAPVPGESPQATVEALYRNEIFFSLRN